MNAKNGSFNSALVIQFCVVSAIPLGGAKLKSVFPGQATKYPALRSSSMNVGGGFLSVDRMWCEPMVVGYSPVTRPERLGAHTGACVKQRVKRAPSLARRSRFGVIASLSP